jgi:hypothetical protein
MKGCTRLSWPIKPAPMLFFAAYQHSARQVFWLSDHFTSRTLPFSVQIQKNSGLADFVPDHSGGTTPESHGIPCSAVSAPYGVLFEAKVRFCQEIVTAKGDKKG